MHTVLSTSRIHSEHGAATLLEFSPCDYLSVGRNTRVADGGVSVTMLPWGPRHDINIRLEQTVPHCPPSVSSSWHPRPPGGHMAGNQGPSWGAGPAVDVRNGARVFVVLVGSGRIPVPWQGSGGATLAEKWSKISIWLKEGAGMKVLA